MHLEKTVTLADKYIEAQESFFASLAAFLVARDARDEAKSTWVKAQAVHPKGHPIRVELATLSRAADAEYDSARTALSAAETAARVAEQTLRDEGDYYAAHESYARQIKLPRAFAAVEAAAEADGLAWLAAVEAVEAAAKEASVWRSLRTMWAESAPKSLARVAREWAMDDAHSHAEWERNQPTSDEGWLRG
jgi:hypothetical protein